MSGGHFDDYPQHRIEEFALNLERAIEQNDVKDNFGYSLSYNENTIKKLTFIKERSEELAKLVRLADYLYAGDIGEESFEESFNEIIKDV